VHQDQDAAADAAWPEGPVPQIDSSALATAIHEAVVSPVVPGAPDPLTPADMDLRGLPFMPLDVNRLRDSGLAIEATADEFRAAILLWCASWNQIPAASLPDSDTSLANYAGYGRDVRGWKRVKKGAMRGFVLCSDGRFYHSVVAEKAAEAWAERLEYREMRENERLRKERERKDRSEMFAKLREYGHVLPHNTPTAKLREHLSEIEKSGGESLGHGVTGHKGVTRTGHAEVTAKKGQGQGQGQGEGRDRDSDSLKAPSSSINTSADIYLRQAGAMARVLRKMGWKECADGHPELIEAAKSGISVSAIEQAAAGKSGKPISYVVQRARGMAADAQANSATAGQGQQPGGMDVEAAAKRDEISALRRALDDKIRTAHNDFALKLIDEQTRDERIAGYQDALAGLVDGGIGGAP
jgi:hypothetical protein